MNQQSISLSRTATMVVFALSCFGLLLFLWNAFGGPVPLKPAGYRVEIPFRQAGQLVEQADVRVSGVPVGKVVGLRPGAAATRAIVEIEPRHAPLPADVRALLRQKTLLGETYIELTPGTRAAPDLPEGAVLPLARVADQVELDQVLGAFDDRTRAGLSRWLRDWGASVDDRGEDVSATVGTLPALTDSAVGVLGVLDRQRAAVRRLLADGSTVFGVTRRRGADLRTIVRRGDELLRTTARRPAQLTATVAGTAAVLRQVRAATVTQQELFTTLRPATRTLLPVADQLPSVLAAAERVGPRLERVAPRLDRLNAVARAGLPATTALLRAVRPALAALEPVGAALTPMAAFLDRYKREFVSSWANAAAATQATTKNGRDGSPLHYVRILIPFDDESLAIATTRSPTVRSNPYAAPGTLNDLGALRSFSCANAANAPTVPRVGSSPPCLTQEPFEVDGRTAQFPHLEPRPLRPSPPPAASASGRRRP